MSDQPTVALIAERRHLENRALCDAQAALQEAGCRVDLVVPDADRLFEVPHEAPAWDAVLSRGRDLAGLGLLAASAALGALAINSPRSIELVRNKITMHAVLRGHHLPLPRTWFASDPSAFRRLPADVFPLVMKPFDGDGARGIALLSRPEDIGAAEPVEDAAPERAGRATLFLAQELLVTNGWDLKLYGIGSEVWAVRKPSPVILERPGPAPVRPTNGAEPVPLDARLRDLALTCGRACGLELWGVDVAMTADGPFIIEVNDFPTYSAVPEAGRAIARHTLALLELARVRRSIGHDRLARLVRSSP